MRKLSISITIIIILILLLVILIVGINRNRPCGGLNDTCFIPHSKGIDFEVAISECQSRCERAKALPDNLRHRHSYCTSSFSIDFDKDYTRHNFKENKFLNTAFIFRDKIQSLKEKNATLLERFTNYLLDNVRIISIQCSNQSFAIKLFQVLNNRGLDLTAADLLKSFLMSKLGGEEEFPPFVQDWIAIENRAKELNESMTDLFTYYEYYLMASNPKKSLYDELEREFRNKDPKEVVHEFRDLLNLFDEIKQQKSKELYGLLYLKHDVYWKSILIAAKLKAWSREQFISLQKLLRDFYYLYWIAEFTSSKTKQTSFNIISWIKEGRDFNFILEKVREKLHEDNVYRRVIDNFNDDAYHEAWCKPVLALLEYQQTDNSNINFIALENDLHVEHILPQGFSSIDYWKKLYSQSEAERLVNKIGNLTLLSGNKNIKASNRPFLEKRDIYEGRGVDGLSGFLLTQAIVHKMMNRENWTADKITERQNRLLVALGKLLNFNPLQEYHQEDEVSESTEELYSRVEQEVLGFGADVTTIKRKFYTAFKRGNNNFVTIQKQREQLKIWLNLPEEELDGLKSIFQYTKKGHHGTGNFEGHFTTTEQLLLFLQAMKLAYSLAGQDMRKWTLDYNLNKTKDQLTLERIQYLIGEIRRLFPSIEEHYSKLYIKFRKNTDFCLIYPQKNQFWLDIKYPKREITDKSLDLRDHNDEIWAHFRVKNDVDLEKLIHWIKKAFDRN